MRLGGRKAMKLTGAGRHQLVYKFLIPSLFSCWAKYNVATFVSLLLNPG